MADTPSGCDIAGLTPGGPADGAGLGLRDTVLSIDGKPIGNCTELLDQVTSHTPGDTVRVQVQRGIGLVTVTIQLSTRDALLQNVLGKPLVDADLVAVDDGARYALSSPQGAVEIVGLYNPLCVDCGSLFGEFSDWARKARRGGKQVRVLAVAVGGEVHDLKALQRSLEVPLFAGDPVLSPDGSGRSPFNDLVIADRERLGVIVIDGRGLVQYVGPIAPNSEDTQAALDEMFAAADQALRSK